jgi:hypothetical protein
METVAMLIVSILLVCVALWLVSAVYAIFGLVHALGGRDIPCAEDLVILAMIIAAVGCMYGAYRFFPFSFVVMT